MTEVILIILLEFILIITLLGLLVWQTKDHNTQVDKLIKAVKSVNVQEYMESTGEVQEEVIKDDRPDYISISDLEDEEFKKFIKDGYLETKEESL